MITIKEEMRTKDGVPIKTKTKTTKTMTIKDGVPTITTTITRTNDGVPAKTTTITTTNKDGVVTQTTTTTEDGAPENTTTAITKDGELAKTTTTNDEAPAKTKVVEPIKTATKEQEEGREDFLDPTRLLIITSGSFYFAYKVFDAVYAFINRKK